VEFWNRDAVEIVERYDSPTALTYCDPPYLHATRTHRKAYNREMSDKDHERLLAALLGCKGRVFISGYDSPLYRRMLVGWKLHTFSMANHAGQGKTKQRRIECLWENPS
jgi:DNA adenine methylase